jgi:hypothetical protein
VKTKTSYFFGAVPKFEMLMRKMKPTLAVNLYSTDVAFTVKPSPLE